MAKDSILMNAQEKSISLRDLVEIVRRRRVAMSIAFATVIALAMTATFLWPATYQAFGTILIEQQEVPADLVRSTISSYADQRIQVITQQVMTTENLYKIVQKYDLYKRERRVGTREAVMLKMRDDIGFRMISADVIDPRSGNPTKATIAFSVSYKNRSADLAARVANELVSLYLQQNLQSRKERAADATSFLTDEAERLSKRINELQSSIASFKEKHVNDLPELSQINIQMMSRADEELREVDARIRSLDQQVVYLGAQLAQISPSSQVYTSTGERVLSPQDRLKYLRTEYARVSGIYAPTHPDVIRLQREIAGLEKTADAAGEVNDLQRQLEDAKSQLASAQQKYSADHPDVIKLQRLQASLTAKLSDAARADNNASVRPVEPDNPAYIQIQAQSEAAKSERDSLQKKRNDLTAQITEFERRLASAPGVEREYSAMTREMENNQLKYREVRQKQMEAQVSQSLEEERKGERFTLIEPPLTPEEPASPNRLLIILLGVVLAGGSAVGSAALLETLDSSVRNRRDLEALLQMPPLAVLPLIETLADRKARKRRRQYALASALGAAIVAIVAIHLFYRPLDVLWQVALRRLAG